MNLVGRLLRFGLTAAALGLSAGCTTTSLVLGAVGVTTDTSIPWAVVKHVHGQLVEGEPRACVLLNSVQRALSARCGSFVAGSIVAADIARTGLAECALALATRDPGLWPVLPELLAQGAQPQACNVPPLVELARFHACPDFAAASPAALQALKTLAVVDARSVHHDVVRMLSCPRAEAAGLDGVLESWRARGALAPRTLGFSALGALHPNMLDGALSQALERDGHQASAALGAYEGRLSAGFEEALRTAHWTALDWWLLRLPELAKQVPPSQGNQLPWLPLARVLVPTFLANAQTQGYIVDYLLSHGADPQQRVPANTNQTVLGLARVLKSPMVARLDPAGTGGQHQRLAAATDQPAGAAHRFDSAKALAE